jgi:hypothetical protein
MSVRHYNIYRGPTPQQIDWSCPVACVPAEETQFDLPAEFAGQRCVLAARSVSSAGVEEHNLHVLAAIEADAAGRLLPPAPPRPTDVSVTPDADGSTLLEFTCQVEPSGGLPERFEVLSDSLTGVLRDEPIAVIPYAGRGEVHVCLAVGAGELLAVRAATAARLGPSSAAIRVPCRPEAVKVIS